MSSRAHPQPDAALSLSEALDAALYAADPVERDIGRLAVARRIDDEGLRGLARALDAPQRRTRRRAARILSEVEPGRVRPVLIEVLRDGALAVRSRSAAARLLSILHGGESAGSQIHEESLQIGLVDPAPAVRRSAASAAAPSEALIRALDDDDVGVVERAAAALLEQSQPIPREVLHRALARLSPVPRALVRAQAQLCADATETCEAALRGERAALDYLDEAATLNRLLDGPHRLDAAWGLARVGQVNPTLATDRDPRVRAAAARSLPGDARELEALQTDSDSGVRWLARRNRAGDYASTALEARLGPHARSNAPSARPPYGLSPADATDDLPRAPAALALCHTRFDINLGVAVRSAEAAGLREIFMVGRGALFRTPARGTDQVIPIRSMADPAEMIRHARAADYQIVALQQTPVSVPFHQADYPPRPLFVVGAEDDGVPPRLRRAADLLIEIPMYGLIDSLNVAAAATCVIFHWRVVCRGDAGDR